MNSLPSIINNNKYVGNKLINNLEDKSWAASQECKGQKNLSLVILLKFQLNISKE